LAKRSRTDNKWSRILAKKSRTDDKKGRIFKKTGKKISFGCEKSVEKGKNIIYQGKTEMKTGEIKI
jgi:transcriptional/translational regulatory protein YebC/TACO1